jgi:hypothetical protein
MNRSMVYKILNYHIWKTEWCLTCFSESIKM